jgi:ubiquinone/menaquinone biosynthesis C-methylase UbiE
VTIRLSGQPRSDLLFLYADDSFDLVTAFLTRHEMPTATRTVVMAEMLRVVNRDGRLLLIDYRSGPIRFPKGSLSNPRWLG